METIKGRPGLGRWDIFKYALGEGAFSVVMNGQSNFAMIFLTQILGLKPAWASFSMSIVILWDAIIDPPMGHISDHTRSRWGRRHPYILVGGCFTALFFFLFWSLPQLFSSAEWAFLAVLAINLLIRTAIAVYSIPYMALGFDICPQYEARAKIQGYRFFLNQIVNFTFGAMAWSLFFQDQVGADGQRIDGSLIASNYVVMGAVLASFSALIVAVCTFGTRRYAVDNRSQPAEHNSPAVFLKDFTSVLGDRLAARIFIFFAVAMLAIMLMAQVQMFVYIFYMKFTSIEKTAVHGAGMLAFAAGSLMLPAVVARLDKKRTAYLAVFLSVSGGLGLLAIFTGGLLVPQQRMVLLSHTIPVATMAFAFCQMCWWGGCGLLAPLVSSMVADVAAIRQQRTGESKNAIYASVFAFSTKAAQAVGMLLCGTIIQLSGIISGSAQQTPEAVRNISVMMFTCSPAVMLMALLILQKYPVSRDYMQKLGLK
jgi:GPH family glycoside/pentoside/hexuronide:cation symporter